MTVVLIILALIELARLILQYRYGKRYDEMQRKTYCKAVEVENTQVFVDRSRLYEELREMGRNRWELVTALPDGVTNGNQYYILFFTRKKIKNFKED